MIVILCLSFFRLKYTKVQISVFLDQHRNLMIFLSIDPLRMKCRRFRTADSTLSSGPNRILPHFPDFVLSYVQPA